MKLKSIVTSIIITISVVYMTACHSGPTNKDSVSTIYQSVNAETKWSLSTTIRKDFKGQPPLHVVESGSLYLLIQKTWSSVLAMNVNHEEWSSEKLKTLVAQQDLAQYLPNPNDAYGGIIWIAKPNKQIKQSPFK